MYLIFILVIFASLSLAGIVPEGCWNGMEGYLQVSAALGLDVFASLGLGEAEELLLVFHDNVLLLITEGLACNIGELKATWPVDKN